MSFKDHFSGHAESYARYRPDYPTELFEYLATLTPRRQYALDCATGSGQAAAGLVQHFERVFATDGSFQQLQHARPHPQITYLCNLAEQPAFRANSLDLVIAAQAAHWFDHGRFYPEVRRVLRPDGALAVWTYGMASIDAQLDGITQRFYDDVVGPYWPPERHFIESAYRSLPFPMKEQATPQLSIGVTWDLDTFVGYIGTWSAVRQYAQAVGVDPLPALKRELAQFWNSERAQRSVVWPLYLRVGRP